LPEGARKRWTPGAIQLWEDHAFTTPFIFTDVTARHLLTQLCEAQNDLDRCVTDWETRRGRGAATIYISNQNTPHADPAMALIPRLRSQVMNATRYLRDQILILQKLSPDADPLTDNSKSHATLPDGTRVPLSALFGPALAGTKLK
jgi:hypothetical protein